MRSQRLNKPQSQTVMVPISLSLHDALKPEEGPAGVPDLIIASLI
jgi:hypothetical protein